MASVRSTDPHARRAAADDAAFERLTELQAFTDAALAHLHFDDLLDTLLERLRRILAVDTAAVLLLDTATDELVARAAKGLEEADVRIPLGRAFAGRIAAERRSIALHEVGPGDVIDPRLLEKGVRSLLGVPLVVEGEVIGVAHVGSLAPRAFDDADAELLQFAADRIALAIQHARLYEAERSAREAAERAVAQIRRIQSVTDVALGRYSLDEPLLSGLLLRVSELLESDTAAVLLLDREANELVARAAKGIEEEVERGVRVPVGAGFAGRIAAEQRPVFLREVDHTTVANPILVEKGIRSLLGVPLMLEGEVTGVLHVGTLTPHEFTPDDTALLELAADRIAIAIDRSRHHGVAAALQEALLPARLPAVPGLELATRYLPAADDARVGGDWYDVLRLPGGRVGLAMGDVVSRGVRAAAAMGEMRTALRAYARDGSSPSSTLARLNDLVRSGEEREMATVAYLVLDPASGGLTYSLAGHPPPLVLSAAGDTRFLDGGRSGPVGVVVGGRFAEATDTLEPGDTVVMYTDGLVERRGVSLEEGLRTLRELAAGAADRPEEVCDRLVGELGSSADDIALLVGRRAVILSEGLDLRFRAVPDSLSAMRRSLAGWLALAGADADETYDIMLAVGESAANAVEHAYGPVDGDFELTAELRGRDVDVAVRDSGRWRPARGDNRGRGLGLIRELMDAVDVDSDGSGTVVRMRRRLGGDDKA